MHEKLAKASFVLLCLFCACQSSPTKRQELEKQLIPPNREAELSEQLNQGLQRAFGAWKDDPAQKYLDSLVAKLLGAEPTYGAALSRVQVRLLASAQPYTAAGVGPVIYLSRGALASAQYENELAFVVATELSLLKEKMTLRNLASLEGQDIGANLFVLPTAPPVVEHDYIERDWFEPGGLFDFGSNAYLKAESDAVRLIYAAKFDPRGAVTYIERWASHSDNRKAVGKILPDPQDRLQQAREEVAKLSPLRDPIVKTKAFEELQANIHVRGAKQHRR